MSDGTVVAQNVEIWGRGGSLIGSWPGSDIREALENAARSGADLTGANLAWDDHALLSEILWRAADTEPRQMLAAYIGRRTDWCWDNWRAWEHPEREWAISVLAPLAAGRAQSGAPEWLADLAPAEEARP